MHPFIAHGLGFDLGESWFTVTAHRRRKRRQETCSLSGMTMGAFGVLDPRIDRLRGLELPVTLPTTIFIQRHRVGSFRYLNNLNEAQFSSTGLDNPVVSRRS